MTAATKIFHPEKHLTLDGSKIRHKAGDVFAIKSRKYQKVTIKNFNGPASSPVTVINSGGIVEIDNRDLRGGAIDIVG